MMTEISLASAEISFPDCPDVVVVVGFNNGGDGRSRTGQHEAEQHHGQTNGTCKSTARNA
jgi:hypothetical protein